MTDVETLSERVRTVERAVTEGEHTFPEVDDLAELTERVETLEQRIEELDERTEKLEGATQALRGYVGNVRSVNERVEQRADTALAATERLERRLEAGDSPARAHSAEQGADAPADRDTRGDAADRRPSASSERTTRAGGPTDASDFELGSEEGPQRQTDDADESADSGVLEQIRSLL